MGVVSMKQLLEAGVHFGHQTRRWNPKMAPYIFTERNGIYIIDLQKTVKKLDEAYMFIRDLSAQGESVLFVGTKKQAGDSIKEEATRAGAYYVNARWLGGMMTNFATIQRRIKRLEQLHEMESDGTFDLLPKKEVGKLQLEIEKLEKFLGGIKDSKKLETVFQENHIDAVIHFAGLKAVGESVQKPLLYYRNNIDTTLSLLECMQKYQVNNIIFSSSATVYGEENPVPYTEEMKRGTCTNPYGWTKVMMEQILEDAAKANEALSVILLRYFNPIGAHESGKIGEDPQGIPNNLMPYVAQVAVGRRDKLTIFGQDYDTPDGTCRRDYIHVVDLAKGHVKAIEYILAHDCVEVFNLGTGTPYSVTEIVETFEKVNNVPVPHVYGPRRAGDLPESYANADKALRVLGWKTEKSLADMCRDTWNWQKNNPNGYQK